ncbi:MAG: hypothetical protein GF365_00195 [Candidatus Buchananbacteria bacterium]|nr:hypothetical protein [Candidatus Buchananbacteria bacterium]
MAKFLGVIMIITVIALFLYYYLYFKKDNLIKYVPKQAVFYSTFHLNEEILKQPLIADFVNQLQNDYNLPNFDLNTLNQFVAYNSALAIVPRQESADLQFDYLLVFNLKPQVIDLDNKLKLIEQSGLNYAVFNNSVLEKNILIISNSNQLIEQVKKINRQEASSLLADLNVLLNLKKFDLDYLAKSYLNIEWFNNNLTKIPDLPVKLMIASLNADNLNDIYLGWQIIDNKLVLESQNLKNSTNQQFLLDKVPDNFLYSFSFYQANQQFTDILELLSVIDPLVGQRIENNKNYLANIYNFDWQQDVLALFADQAQIIVDQDNNWILGLNLVEINDREAKILKLEQIIKQYIAYNNPIEREKMLPDYTYITQIIKNPDNLEFQQEKIFNSSLKTIKQANLEFAYYINDQQLFLANSSQIIKNYLLNQNVQIINEHCSVNKPDFKQNLLVKTNYLSQYWPYFKYFKYLKLNENVDNGQIWLCLE